MKRIIWVEWLGFIDLIFLFFLQTLNNNYVIYYDKHKISPLSMKLLNLIKKINICSRFYPTILSLNKKDPKGYALSYQKENNFDHCIEEFCKYSISDKPEWFKKMIKAYIASFLSTRVSFITTVESKSEFQNKQKHILYLVRHPLNYIILNFYINKGFFIMQSLSPIASIIFFIKPFFRLIFTVLIKKLSFKKVKTNISQIRPSVWIEYAHKDVFDFAFWHQPASAKNFDVVYYLDRQDTPCNEEIISEIEKKGLKWIDAHIASLAKLSSFTLSDLKEMFRGLLRSISLPLPIWFKLFLFEKDIRFMLYRSIFKFAQVKLLIQHQNTSWVQEVQKMAVKSSGGIMVGFHWSNNAFYKEALQLRLYHVYFVWGKIFYEWAKKRGDTYNYALPSGVYITHDKKKSQQLCFSERINFVIAMFDSSVSYDIYQSPKTLSEFYIRILQLLEDNPSWGMIVKSKNWNLEGLNYLPNGKDIVQRLKSLIKGKRAVILDRTTSPVTAASYANLSVGYGLNSAVIVSAIHGYHGIHWDCSGWLKHPFYKDPTQKFIYQSLDELEEAIISASKGDKSIGDFSKWRQKFNYFDDLNAPERIGKFIQDFMDEVIRTDDGKHSMDFAVKKYIEENGIKDDFFKMDNLWENE